MKESSHTGLQIIMAVCYFGDLQIRSPVQDSTARFQPNAQARYPQENFLRSLGATKFAWLKCQ